MQILIRCRRPSELAARFFEEEHVVEVRLHHDRQGLLVKTSNPARFYRSMNLLARNGVGIEAVAPVDDDVNSVYEYLIGGEETLR
jgi:ABC-2 type transport system ATP-binding protein